jgi:hypothetical protein
MKLYSVGIFPYMALAWALHMVGTSNFRYSGIVKLEPIKKCPAYLGFLSTIGGK